jgi:hypothetical protein
LLSKKQKQEEMTTPYTPFSTKEGTDLLDQIVRHQDQKKHLLEKASTFRRWCKKESKEKKNHLARICLGICYLSGYGGKRKEGKALKLFESIEQSSGFSSYTMVAVQLMEQCVKRNIAQETAKIRVTSFE